MGKLGSGDRISVRHGRPISSCFKRYNSQAFQMTALWFLVFTMHIAWVMSARDTTIVLNHYDNKYGIRGVWNETLQRSINHCSKFHVANASDYFFSWPEDNPHFHFCCEFVPPSIANTMDFQNYQNLSDYTYSVYGYTIGYGMYWDLGLIDNCFPFWKCSGLYQQYQDTPTFGTYCESQDVIALFQYRFSHLVIWRYGLLQTALPAIGLLELFVVLAILGELLYMKYHRYRKHFTRLDKQKHPWRKEAWTIFIHWLYSTHRIVLMDWLHICLLSFVGNGLLEAVGRDNAFLWTSKLFYNYTHVYHGLLVVLCCSSALQQLAQWIAVDKNETWNFEEHDVDEEKGHADEGNKKFQGAPHQSHQDVKTCLCCNKDENDPIKELRKLLRLNPDWKWQPIAAQSAILFCLWGYLTYIITESTASTVLGFVVQAASPWSGLYALRVTFVTVPFIISKANNAKTCHEVIGKIKGKMTLSK